MFSGSAASWKCSEYRARKRRFAPTMSSRPLRTNAGTPDIASSMCCTAGRIRCCGRRRRRGVDVCAARARSKRWARSASSSCSARASASSTVSETPAGVAAFEARVVVDADAGEQRHFLPAQTGDATRAAAVRAQARLLGRHPRAPGGQELADLVAGVHDVETSPASARAEGACQYLDQQGRSVAAGTCFSGAARRAERRD